jgi:acyl carrier protein
MTNQEIINLIEDALEVDMNTLSESTLLSELTEYDSMAKLTIIVLADDEFDKKLTGETMKEFKTIGDIVDFLK